MKRMIAIFALVPALALAGKPSHEKPEQIGVNLQGQIQGQVANGGKGGNADATGVGVGIGKGGDASAIGVGGEQSQHQNATAVAGQHQSANNEGNQLSAGYSFDSKSLALALPGATADNGSTASCLESKRGVSILGVGWSGRTAVNEECFAHQRCIQLATLYAQLNRTDLAVQQLASCGGQEAAEPQNFVTREELIEREERIVEKVFAK